MPFPINFKPKNSYRLIRIGNNSDGGYLIDVESVKRSSFLLSMGISTDWSFEKDFLKLNSVPAHLYDHTLTIGFFVMYTIKGFLGIFLGRIKDFFLTIKVLIDYPFFFRKPICLYKQKIGCEDEGAVSLNKTLSRISQYEKLQVFLKIDIEGSEYRILNEIVDNAKFFSGLVIEFHDADLNVERISNFINEFPLELVHAHANNNWGAGLDNNTQLLELSFSKYPEIISSETQIPHPLDRINNPELPAILLEFE